MPPHRSNAGVPILEARRVSKSFAGVRALVEVSLALEPGKVHALMGENGAGKSTLMKVLAGLHLPDSGEIRLRGRPIALRSPHQAIVHGIAMIHQELMPIPDLTVAENILLGCEPGSRLPGWIDRRAMRREARRLLDLLEVDLPVTRKMRHLSVAQMQTVEIAKALGREANILIMDEPTAAISDREVDALFKVIAMLKQRGVAIVYITHKMEEVFRGADKITVLRDGSQVGTYPAGQLDRPTLIALMVGRTGTGTVGGQTPTQGVGWVERSEPHQNRPHPGRWGSLRSTHPTQIGHDTGTACKQAVPHDIEIAMSVRGLSRDSAFHNVSFDVRRGEILGITGLMGAGRTELLSAVFGLVPADDGEIRVAGRPVRIRGPADALRHGIGMVTEDRKGFGLVPTMSVAENMTLSSLGQCCFGPLVRRAKENAVVEAGIRALAIKTAGGRQAVGQLSGGNQQKVVIARSLLAGPSILLLDEPTRGIDVAAKAEIYALVTRLAAEGKAVVFVSSELPEALALSHRLLVMRQGKVAAELNPSCTSQEEVLKYAMPL